MIFLKLLSITFVLILLFEVYLFELLNCVLLNVLTSVEVKLCQTDNIRKIVFDSFDLWVNIISCESGSDKENVFGIQINSQSKC